MKHTTKRKAKKSTTSSKRRTTGGRKAKTTLKSASRAEVYGINEAAGILGIGPNYLRKLILSGRLKATKNLSKNTRGVWEITSAAIEARREFVKALELKGIKTAAAA